MVPPNGTGKPMPFYTFTHQPGSGGSTTKAFPDDAAAERDANRAARALVQTHRPMSQGERITVRDAAGRLVHEAYLSIAALKIERVPVAAPHTPQDDT
jgi:hypothetical protein